MFFSGTAGVQRKVDLRGRRDRREESREQVLERTKAERERRQRNKLENRSALTIQVRRRPGLAVVEDLLCWLLVRWLSAL